MPGSDGALGSDIKENAALAKKMGYPIILKAAAGGEWSRHARGAQ